MAGQGQASRLELDDTYIAHLYAELAEVALSHLCLTFPAYSI